MIIFIFYVVQRMLVPGKLKLTKWSLFSSTRTCNNLIVQNFYSPISVLLVRFFFNFFFPLLQKFRIMGGRRRRRRYWRLNFMTRVVCIKFLLQVCPHRASVVDEENSLFCTPMCISQLCMTLLAGGNFQPPFTHWCIIGPVDAMDWFFI